MTITVDHIAAYLDQQAPPTTKLDFDNIGLLLGERSQSVSTILCCLDVTPQVVQEAIEKQVDLIVAHHPLIFKKLSRIDTSTEQGRMIRDLLASDIAVFAAHTNYDIANDGVSFIMAERLELHSCRFLNPIQSEDCLLELTTVSGKAERLKSVLERYGDPIAYSSAANGEAHLKVATQRYLLKELYKELEETDSNVISWSSDIRQEDPWHGLGVVGELHNPLTPDELLQQLQNTFEPGHISYTGNPQAIRRVAVCGGAGAPLISNAIAVADAYVTADLKYHDYFTGTEHFLLADIGHYESEIPAVDDLAGRLARRFSEVTIETTSVNTNPINHRKYFDYKGH